MLIEQKSFFLGGGDVNGLTEDALLVFLIGVFQEIKNKKILCLSDSDILNKRICGDSMWFGKEFVYYPEKDTNKTVPGFISQYNRYRSSAIIKIATKKSICCFSTTQASKKANINKKTKPIRFKIKIGATIDRDGFIKRITDLGYTRVDTVFKTGDLSIKGDIVDVFPVYEKEPVRISFSFNKIESISFFNVDTQRSERLVQSYGFWDVFERHVDLGRSLVDFIVWDEVVKIVKQGGFYSVVQAKQRGSTNLRVSSLQTKINSKKAFLSFLEKNPTSTFYLFYTNKNKNRSFSNKKIFAVPGKINNSFFVKENMSFYIPFWKNKPRDLKTKTPHKPLLIIDLNKIKKGDLVVHVSHGVGTYDGLKIRGARGLWHCPNTAVC